MYYNRVNSSESEYESVRGIDYEEEIQLNDTTQERGAQSRWSKFMNKIIYHPFERVLDFLSKYYIFNKLIDICFEIKYWIDEKNEKRPYVKPAIIFVIVSTSIIFFSILGWSHYIDYVNTLASYEDSEFEFNRNLTSLADQEYNRQDERISEMLNEMLSHYAIDFSDLPPSEQHKLNLLHQMRDAKNVERSSSFSWVPKLLKGSSDKVQGARWEALDRLRRLQIRKSFLHSWNSYKELAFGHDQILPLRKTYTDDYQGFGMTLFDNLDTLIIMGLKEEFENAKKQALSVDFSKLSGTIEFDKFISSCLGGLLGAYELTNDDDLLAKAEEVAQLSMIAFETSHGLPTSTFKFNGDNTNEKWTTISKLSSFQLEFIKLGKLTDNQTYIEKANLVRNLFDLTILDIPGIFPTQFDIEVIKPSGKSSLDKDGGRYYDVLFKEYLLLNKKDQRLKEKYLKSLNAIQRKLVIGHPDMGKTFLGGLNTDNQLEYAMSHYSCFFPGLIALSSHVLNRVKDIELAENITSTCLNLYKSAPTQLAPEHIYFLGVNPNDYYSKISSFTNSTFFEENYFSIYDANFLLSSETVESLFYLYRRTKNRKYQQMGWDIFIAIEKHCKVKYGYSTYDNVLTERKYQNSNKVLLGEMPSSFLSKTLKYLYLLFSPLEQVPNRSNSASSINDPSLDFHLDLNAFILSPGAHPLKIITDS